MQRYYYDSTQNTQYSTGYIILLCFRVCVVVTFHCHSTYAACHHQSKSHIKTSVLRSLNNQSSLSHSSYDSLCGELLSELLGAARSCSHSLLTTTNR